MGGRNHSIAEIKIQTSAADHSRVLATMQAQRPKAILWIKQHRCTHSNYMYVSTELCGISIKVQIHRERRVGDEKMRPRPRSIMRYPRDSVSTTVERSDCVDNALRARYPTTNTLWGRGVMDRWISVRSGGAEMRRRHWKCEAYQQQCPQSEQSDKLYTVLWLHTGFGVVRAVYTTKMRPDVLTKLAFTKGRGRRWWEKARSSQGIKTSSITRPLLTHVAPGHGFDGIWQLWDLFLI